MANGFDTTEESYVGDDPTGIGYDEAGTSVASGVGYGSENIDTGGNETTGQVLSQAGFNQAMDISIKNPYGNDNFLTQFFGIPAQYLDYRPLGIDTGGIANLAYDRYLNPFVGNIKTGENLKLREGLSEGEKTRFGEVISIDRPQGIGETIARTAFGLATPLGPLASLIGTDQLALAPNPNITLFGDKSTGFRGSPNYDPTLDPNNPAYQGPQSMLGGIGKTLEQITFGGARPVTKTGKGILDLMQGQEAEKEMKDSVDQTGSNVKLGPESFLKNESIRDPMYFDPSPGRMRAVFGEGVASLLGGLTPAEAMRYANITKPSETGTVPPYSDPLLSRDQQIAKDVSNILAYRNYIKGTDRIPENMAFADLYDKTTPGTTDYMESLGFTRPF